MESKKGAFDPALLNLTIRGYDYNAWPPLSNSDIIDLGLGVELDTYILKKLPTVILMCRHQDLFAKENPRLPTGEGLLIPVRWGGERFLPHFLSSAFPQLTKEPGLTAK